MRSINSIPVILILSAIIFPGCIGTKFGSANKKEALNMKIKEQPDVINYAVLQRQEVPNLASRGDKGRGPLSGLAGGAISLATSAIKQMIANDKKKYTAQYEFALTDLYFYDQLSTEGPFDPIGMQFSGFKVVRTFDNKGVRDTALIAEFELDVENPYEVINNSVFRLRLKSLELNYAKAKIAAGNKNLLNMDFEITFHTSYVNAEGHLFKAVELGTFYFFLRKAPLDKDTEEHAAFYEKLKGKKLEGQSFIVPRSFGYHITGQNLTEPVYSQGAYIIDVKVKESSKNSFVNQLAIDNSGKLMDALGDQLKKKIK